MSSSDNEDDQDTFEEKGVAEEKGLRTLIDSDAEDEEDEEKKEEQPDDEKKNKNKTNGNSMDTESSSGLNSDINRQTSKPTEKSECEKNHEERQVECAGYENNVWLVKAPK